MSKVQKSLQKLGAGLLAVTVIGCVYGMLAMTLVCPQPKPANEVVTVQATAPAIETVTVTGTRQAG